VSDEEINSIKLCIEKKAELRRHPFFAEGDLVKVRGGAFAGVQGIVVRHKNGCKLIVSIGLIQQSVAMEIDAQSLEYVGPPTANPGPCRTGIRERAGRRVWAQ
jgi:transcription antitermination factor NusG